jgi:DNA-binding response OmpR family regulator
VCSELPGLGVVVCTGQSTVAQRVRGLRLGADDWLSKPCHPEELIARVEAVVRRRRRSDARVERGPVAAGELEIRSDRFQAFVDGRSVDLTRREFELIELLAGSEGRVLEREEIYQRVWGYAMARGDRSVDVFVRKLRQKLEKASADWRYIHTHFGVGYRFAAEPVEGSTPAEREAEARVAEPADGPAPSTLGLGADVEAELRALTQ